MCGGEIGGRKRFEGIKRKQRDKRKRGVGGWGSRKTSGMWTAMECTKTQGYLAPHWHAEIGWSVSYCGPAGGGKELSGSRSTQTAEPYLTSVTKPSPTTPPVHFMARAHFHLFKELQVTSQRKPG